MGKFSYELISVILVNNGLRGEEVMEEGGAEVVEEGGAEVVEGGGAGVVRK